MTRVGTAWTEAATTQRSAGELVLDANRADQDIFTYVSRKLWPPEVLLQEGNGAVHPRMTGKSGRVSPVRYMSANGSRHQELTWVSIPRIWVGPLGLVDSISPSDPIAKEAGRTGLDQHCLR